MYIKFAKNNLKLEIYIKVLYLKVIREQKMCVHMQNNVPKSA